MNNLGTVEIITFRATRHEHPYFESILGLIRGTSSGHIALRINFNDQELFNKYIRNNINIPHRIILDPITKKEIYQVYVSFWPDGSWTPWHNDSTLKTYLFDCEQSASYSSIDYDPARAAYFNPLQRVTNSSIPPLKMLGNTVISLPPTIIMHTSRLGAAFGDNNLASSSTSLVVVAAAENFSRKYTAWRTAIVAEQNTKTLFPKNNSMFSSQTKLTSIAKARMLNSQKKLCAAMYPTEQISSDEFINRLDPFVTFGYPERDTVSLPLSKRGNVTGIELEPMLSYINTIATYSNKFPYHVLGNNCARVIYKILWQGCKYAETKQLQKVLVLPWLMHRFRVTLTPAFAIRHLVKLQKLISDLQEKTKIDSTPSLPEVGNAKMQEVSIQNRYLADRQNTLSFYTQNKEIDDISTVKIGICARSSDNITQYIRS